MQERRTGEEERRGEETLYCDVCTCQYKGEKEREEEREKDTRRKEDKRGEERGGRGEY